VVEIRPDILFELLKKEGLLQL